MKASLEKHVEQEHASYRFHCRVDSAFGFVWHYHPEYELTLIEAGRGRRFVGDQIVDFKEGDLALLGPNLPHTWHSSPEKPKRKGTHLAITAQFKEDFLGEGFFERRELVKVRRLLHRSELGLHVGGPVRVEVAKDMARMRDLDGFPRLLVLLGILEKLSRSRTLEVISSKGFQPMLRRADEPLMDGICKYINDRYQEPITQAGVAAHAHMSVSSLGRLFKRCVGKGFNQYLNELRVGHACRLLIEDSLSILDVCYAAGYQNLSNFNRRFLAMKGVTPGTYRKTFWEHQR